MQVSVNRALKEAKTLRKRIEEAIPNVHVCVANKNSNDKIKGIPILDFMKSMVASYDKAVSLITRYNAIQSAIAKSNASARTTVAGKEYTVAELIELKSHGMVYKKMLYDRIRREFNEAQNNVESSLLDDKLQKNADDFIAKAFGTNAKSSDAAAVSAARENYIKANSYSLITGINVEKVLEEMDKELSDFYDEVDAALNDINAQTMVELPDM